mgnify:CR=1 FL=1
MPAISISIGAVVAMLAVPVAAVVTPPQRTNDASAERRSNHQHDADPGKVASEIHLVLLGDLQGHLDHQRGLRCRVDRQRPVRGKAQVKTRGIGDGPALLQRAAPVF